MIDPHGWQPIEDGLPDCKGLKSPDQCWLVTDGKRRWLETTHPSWWNVEGPNPTIVVTHWQDIDDLPDPPKETP